ncbi:MAG: hypothetical protein AB7E51_15040 [Pseudodesulfovibrio sp.]|uniref:hypothetical protein n=1 Tax=Pseudodesulfovibrio sp. TaxID=2035812 RepID=UPI003D0EEB05
MKISIEERQSHRRIGNMMKAILGILAGATLAEAESALFQAQGEINNAKRALELSTKFNPGQDALAACTVSDGEDGPQDA